MFTDINSSNTDAREHTQRSPGRPGPRKDSANSWDGRGAGRSLQGERIKIHLHYRVALAWDKCTGIRFPRISPVFRRIAWPLSLAWARSRSTLLPSRTLGFANAPTIV